MEVLKVDLRPREEVSAHWEAEERGLPRTSRLREKIMTTVFKMSEAWYQILEVPHRALTYSILCEESPQSYVSIITRRGLLSDQLWIVLMKSLNFVYACQEVDINDVVRLAALPEGRRESFLFD